MKKIISILVVALVMAGCSSGNEISCTTTGELMYQPANGYVGNSAISVSNTTQTCTNLEQGVIMIVPNSMVKGK